MHCRDAQGLSRIHYLIRVLSWEPHPSALGCHRLFQWGYLHIMHFKSL